MTEERQELVNNLKAKIKKYTKLLEELQPKEEQPLVETFLSVEKRVKERPQEPKYSTGLFWLDRNMNGGFTRGSFINLAGVSFSGKSTLALKILGNIAEYKKVVFFNFEMYETILVQELKNLEDAQKENILIVQKGYEIETVEKIIRDQAARGVVFFAIDSKMKIKVNYDGKEYQQISKLSNMLSRLTQELGIILLLINQINEEDRKSGKFGLKGSGDQTYDSDVIMFIDVVAKKGESEKRICYCAKDRYNKRKWTEDITNNIPAVMEYKEKIEMAII